ncbi:hypothetical protein L6452_36548 [Arctium lappa]|uniref:Uncharacterized protein n=1 Tax=Arctium lappa TaxID=4217 RepID=A0ACB8YAN0_ARCLA|nr:hypothetical protein L6452_36548 [Arctium lappa]
MPTLLKRMKDCISRIDKLDSFDNGIHPTLFEIEDRADRTLLDHWIETDAGLLIGNVFFDRDRGTVKDFMWSVIEIDDITTESSVDVDSSSNSREVTMEQAYDSGWNRPGLLEQAYDSGWFEVNSNCSSRNVATVAAVTGVQLYAARRLALELSIKLITTVLYYNGFVQKKKTKLFNNEYLSPLSAAACLHLCSIVPSNLKELNPQMFSSNDKYHS